MIYILSYLENSTLRQCSLVSRAWASPARYHLFKNVKYHFRAERLMEDGIENTASFPLEDLLVFFMLNPSVPSHIRHMKLVMDTVVRRHERPEYAFPPMPARLDTLYAILQHTKSLSTLTLTSFRFKSSDISAPSSLLDRVPAIEHLDSIRVDCEGMWTASVEDYVFPVLQLVGTVDKLVTTAGTKSSTSSLPPSLRLNKQLREVHVIKGSVARCLESAVDFGNLQLLDMKILEESEVEWLTRVLTMAGGNMRHLSIELLNDHCYTKGRGTLALALDPLTHLNELDLTCLSNVESLSLSLPVFCNLSVPFTEGSALYLYKPTHSFLKKTLSLLPPSLHTIGLRMHLATARFEYDLHGTVLATVFHPWNEIDTMLATRIAQMGLHRVEIHIDAIKLRVESTRARRCMALALPKVGATGALVFGGFTLAKRFESWK